MRGITQPKQIKLEGRNMIRILFTRFNNFKGLCSPLSGRTEPNLVLLFLLSMMTILRIVTNLAIPSEKKAETLTHTEKKAISTLT